MKCRPRVTWQTLVSCLLLLFTLATAGSSTASAADYPLPTTGIGEVDHTTVHAGECVWFSGGGFKPDSTVIVKDEGRVVGQTKANSHGRFHYRVCFATDASLGKHVLSAEGTGANGAGRVVTATVTVVGVAATRHVTSPDAVSGDGGANGAANGGGAGGTLPFTGADILELVLFGLALLALGMLLVSRGNRRRRARRLRRAAA